MKKCPALPEVLLNDYGKKKVARLLNCTIKRRNNFFTYYLIAEEYSASICFKIQTLATFPL